MANYTQTTNFSDKDALPSGDPEKKILGSDVDTELSNIQTAVNSKADNDLSNLTTAGENVIVSFGVPTGTVVPYTATTAPSGWLLCDGREVSRSTYSALNALYEADGYPYGNGNGSTTFNLPDLRGRGFMFLDDMGTAAGAANRLSSTGAGESFTSGDEDTLGSSGGSDRHTLTAAQSGLPAHNHSLSGGVLRGQGESSGGTVNRPASATASRSGQLDDNFVINNNSAQNASQAHPNLGPFQMLNAIIKV